MELDIDTISKGGFATALIALLYFVGMRLIAAVDRVAVKVDEHTAKDLAHHAEVKEEIAGMRAMVETAIGVQEIRDAKSGPVRATPTGAGVYGIAREKTRGG